VVEIPIARFAACRASDEDRQLLRAIAFRFSPDMALDEFRQLDREFHSAIARACGNATLAEVHGKVMESLFKSREFDTLLDSKQNRAVVREIIRDAAGMHQEIADAIARGDWAAAVECADAHLEQVEKQMIAKMV
ncbi:MAG: hypothetical protein C4321_02135, partial [Chloroflexota bacterium]